MQMYLSLLNLPNLIIQLNYFNLYTQIFSKMIEFNLICFYENRQIYYF